MRNNIPNFFTLANLLFGCIATVAALNNNLVGASYCVGFSLIFDFLDGFMARALKANSPIGKELDSLADMVSFGLVPGVIMFKLIGGALIYQSIQENMSLEARTVYTKLSYVAFLITLFSAWRLAKFNIDTRQHKTFIGLATPGNTLLIASFPLVIENPTNINEWLLNSAVLNPYFLLVLVVFLSYLLVANIRMFSFKMETFSFADNKPQYILVVSSIILIAFFQYIGLLLVVPLYILLSLVFGGLKKKPTQ
ncbi:MAG: CDP-alcohol phosphatidyltransferase family protein [Bacteroidetes bacterium]|nr:CDP-alcohol phosphatidyltransferase family protein [Bacteroidota bacterium]